MLGTAWLRLSAAGLCSVLCNTMGCVSSDATRVSAQPVLGYVLTLPPETEASRADRLARVRERRSRGAVILHRGDRAASPENTLPAFAAAMDAGADGFEVDVALSKDGVLFAWHDRRLNSSNARGFHGKTPRGVTYHQLLSVTPVQAKVYGRADHETRPPTLAAVLAVARQRGALIHIDPKDRRRIAQEAIADLLTRHDMWEHLVFVHHPWLYPHLAGRPEADLLRWTRYDEARTLAWHRSQAGTVYQDWQDRSTGDYAAVMAIRGAGLRAERLPLPQGLRAVWGPGGVQRRALNAEDQ